MTKIVNLDAIVTRRDKVVVLDGKEHVMATFTVKDYIHQMKTGEEINKLMEDVTIDGATRVMELTIEALSKAFPTISVERLMSLTLPQLTTLRELTEDINTAEASGEDEAEETDQGEANGEAE